MKHTLNILRKSSYLEIKTVIMSVILQTRTKSLTHSTLPNSVWLQYTEFHFIVDQEIWTVVIRDCIILYCQWQNSILYVTYTMPLCTQLLCWPPHLPACRPANLKSVFGFSNGIYLRGSDIIPSPTPQPGEPDVAATVYGHLTTKKSRHQQNGHCIITLQ